VGGGMERGEGKMMSFIANLVLLISAAKELVVTGITIYYSLK
jgi:hypothetical protein